MPKFSKPVRIVLWVVAPFVLIVACIILYALVNFISAATTPASTDSLFAQPPLWVAVVNVGLFLVGALAVVLVPVGIVMAIVTAAKADPIAPLPQAPTPTAPVVPAPTPLAAPTDTPPAAPTGTPPTD